MKKLITDIRYYLFGYYLFGYYLFPYDPFMNEFGIENELWKWKIVNSKPLSQAFCACGFPFSSLNIKFINSIYDMMDWNGFTWMSWMSLTWTTTTNHLA